MANSPPELLKLRHHARMKTSSAGDWSGPAYSTMLLLFSFILISVAAAVEIDNDLVFEDGTSDLSARAYGRARHGRNSTSFTHNKRVEQLVAPVQSPQTVDDILDEGDSDNDVGGLLAALHGLGERAKRTLWGGLEMLGHTRQRRQADEDQDNEVDHDQDFDQDDTDDQETAFHQVGNSDDEDYIGDDVSGSGDQPETTPRFYRITLNVQEPFQPEFNDKRSAEFLDLQNALVPDIKNLYRDWPGRRSATVINVSENPQDRFFILVTLDLGVAGYGSEQEVKERLLNHIRSVGQLGGLQVKEPLTFRAFPVQGRPETRPPACGNYELQCRSGECVPQSYRCDNIPQCSDGSDEIGCPPQSTVTQDVSRQPQLGPPEGRLIETTTSAEYEPRTVPVPQPDPPVDRCRADDKVRCGDGSIYICQTQVCDGRPDCPGGTDEEDCGLPQPPTPGACRVGEFMCDITRCISQSQRCDGRRDCNDGTDEQSCPCRPGEFRCDDGTCIDERLKCDRRPDCPDYTDELQCPVCSSDEWQCNDGTCISRRLRCNGVKDCRADNSDEDGCVPPTVQNCTEDEFRCESGTCILRSLWCNDKYDCPPGDFSDEKKCPCTPQHFECDNKVCVPLDRRCDGFYDCQDRSDERNCSVPCKENEFQCADKSCIHISLRCNRQTDCLDGSDESGCDDSSTCRSDQFRCNDGLCLSISQRCNGFPECLSGEDEDGCGGCGPTEFSCKDGLKCIDQIRRCDGNRDCADGSDEGAECGCGPDKFHCGNGDCIRNDQRCDDVIDCPNAADEQGCATRCRPDEFECSNGECITYSYYCDGQADCTDNSDEANCPSPTCSPSEFMCDDGTCVGLSKKCDNIFDCFDNSDERDCAGRCNLDQFQCNDGTCIPESRRCDEYRDCPDASDENNCPTTCGPNEFTCEDGRCIDSSWRCDRRPDCPDGSDEKDCGCQPNQFQCGNGECISLANRCNRQYDCRDGTDEFGCENVTTTPPPITTTPSSSLPCGYGQFMCRRSRECIPQSAVCNKRIDCQDFSDEDEAYCNPSRGGLNLRTYPDDQIIKEVAEGREVVFQCRDEGPLRARVRWLRGNGLPLPPGSRDVNGRLEMPDIQVEHSGTYICEAIGYPRDTPGQQVSVHLTVEQFSPPPTRPADACGWNEATCANGECISKNLVCDGNIDCSDGSDETRCSPGGCEPNEFRCSNKRCVLKTWRCDSDDDCGDGSDEQNCATGPPDSPCRYNEFQCRTRQQCIPKSFHCDLQNDCLDNSDEIGCSPVVIVTPPAPMVILDQGSVFTITCTAIGVPTPEVIWRLNWGHIPSKCTTDSKNGVGTLTCPNIQESDQGAYSCEAINNRGSTFAVPDSILVVKKPPSICPRGYFNDDASSPNECISCFCFGITTECKSANLFTYQLPPPLTEFKIVGVRVDPDGSVNIRPEPPFRSSPIRSQTRNGFQLYTPSPERSGDGTYPYFALPENYHGNQLKSYGGYLKFTVRPEGRGQLLRIPEVILSGNGYTLVYHSPSQIIPSQSNDVSVHFFYGDWYKRTVNNRPGGDIPISSIDEEKASREEIMMVLNNVDNILIKGQYIEGPFIDTTFSNIAMDSAGIRNTGLGKASFVEECRCPAGYAGLSCEQCAPGYHRHQSGPWLGHCTKETVPCPPGQFGDPSRNIPCQDCPCPLTTSTNQFGQTCQLDTDGQVTCNCPAGYVGRRCERCDTGYEGNPIIAGDSCRPASQCDPAGSIDPVPDQTGRCRCKEHVTGPQCNQCKADAFHLDPKNENGCIPCFCMGITEQCTSSNWYRQQVSASFTRSANDFKLVEAQDKEKPITEGIRFEARSREIVFSDFSWRSPNVYYWTLPSHFLGDKITAYGGQLKYTVRYVPAPGGQSSRNNAPDVQLISTNDIHLMYYSREQINPDRPQTVEVPLLEQYWQRQDGQPADREHMLMTLADLGSILIKATYTTNTREAALISVSLDVAEDRNTGQTRALEVEQCQCPVGYRGLSCQDCAVGYTRTDGGLYLGFCEPCECNGRSEECDPETGVCANCRDNTAGPHCDECPEGYEGDPDRGCVPGNFIDRDCRCDPRGSQQTTCVDGRTCICKTNVEGPRCDKCRRGTFDLSADNIEGCLECFCSGVSEFCQASNLQRQQIPMQIIDQNHGFTLTDNNRQYVIREGFELNVAQNEIGYNFGGRDQRLFWSLPPQFTGNKVASYGGSLSVTQRYTARAGSVRSDDTDIVIVGSGISIYWTGSLDWQPDKPMTYSVPLRESEWQRLVQTGPRTASRADLLTVLSNVEAILIRAHHATQTLQTFISDVTLDTAVEQNTGQGVVRSVEVCRCPQGYRGTSCESCATGYYKVFTNREDGVSVCERCPCNGNEESCSATPTGGVECKCVPGYSGRFCDTTDVPTPTVGPPAPQPTIIVTISEPAITIVEVGGTARFQCSGQSVRQVPVRITWSKEGGVLPRDRAVDDSRGVLIIARVQPPDSGVYVCSVTDGRETVSQRTTLTVGGQRPVAPEISISPPSLTLREGESAEFQCDARGSPAPTIGWSRGDNRPLGPQTYVSGGLLRIRSVRTSDEGEYHCHAWNPAGNVTRRTILFVREGQVPPPPLPPPGRTLTVEPSEYSGPEGETIRIVCRGQPDATLQWSRAGNRELPPFARPSDGTLILYNPTAADSGVYVCRSLRYPGSPEEVQVQITISSRRAPPTAKIEPERQTVPQGTIAELRCVATGDPTPQITWSKVGEELPSNVQVTGSLLRILNVLVRDRGVYVCRATGVGGTVAQSSAIIEVERRERPSVDLYPGPEQTVLTGSSVLLQCRITGGYPQPTLRWSRADGRPISSHVEQMEGGVLRFTQVTEADKGQYVCQAENPAGTASVTAVLNIQSRPTITITPSSPVVATVGQRVRMECRASGDPMPIITWSKHRPGTSFYDAQPVTSERQQSAIFEITRVSKSDEGSYTCQAKNAAGVAEERLYLTVEENNVIPGGQDGGYPVGPGPTYEPPRGPGSSPYLPNDFFDVPVGGRTVMRCSATGPADAGELFLNWVRSDGRPLPDSSSQNKGYLYLNNVQKEDEGEYSCLGYRGSNLEFRATARLKVTAPPRITLYPHRQEVRPGNDANITCTATGDQPISIDWTAVSRSLPRSVIIQGGLLQFRGISVSDAGRYLCTARNPAGQVESIAEVIVRDGPSRPQTSSTQRDQSAFVDSSVTLRCSVPPGYRPRSYDWSRDRAPLPQNAVVQDNVLILQGVQVQDRGRYICRALTNEGEITTYINLRVDQFGDGCTQRGEFPCQSGECVRLENLCDGYPDCQDGSDEERCPSRKGRGLQNLALRIDPSKDVIRVGDTVDVRCLAKGDPDVSYSWSKIGEALPDNVIIAEDIMRVSNVRADNGGVYRCTVRASSGQYSEDYVLTIQDAPGLSDDAAAVETRTAPYGSTVTLDCKIDLEPPITYSWSKQGGVLPRTAESQSDVLTLRDIGAQDAGTYICTAQNNNIRMDIPTVLVVTGIVPYFAQSPSSYMVLPTLADAYTRFSISVSFKPEQPNGLILYNGQESGGSGDFISLGLNDGHVEFRFDVGSGPAIIRSSEPVTMNQWHTVRLQRERRLGTMYVDEQSPVKGQTTGRFIGLDLVQPLYLGSVPNFSAINKLNGFREGFVGCLSRLVIGSRVVELVREANASRSMMICDTCEAKPCQNNGICQEANEPLGYTCICPIGYSGQNCDRVGKACYPGACGTGKCKDHTGGFKCYCPFGKAGERCERDIEIVEPAFADDAYVAYPTPIRAVRQFNISINFKPADYEDGVLMYCAQDEDGHGDFTSLTIRKRRVEFRFDTGSGPAIIRSEQDLVPGQWTTVTARRNMRLGEVSVNNEEPIQGRSPGVTGGLNLRTPLYIGGVDKHRVTLAKGVEVQKNFRGCVSEIKVGNTSIEIVNSVVDAANVGECNRDSAASPCDRNPCRNGGVCRPASNGNYECSCQYGFSGKNCETEADVCQALRPCQNGGSCIGSSQTYKCRCPLGFGGDDCEQRVYFSTEVGFQGDGYLELSNALLPHKSPTDSENIVIEFTTSEPNGLIFWHGQTPDIDGKNQDYLALAVVNGTLEFAYELGSGPAVIQATKRPVADGLRHRVVLKRLATDGSLELDGDITEFGKSQGILQVLNTRGNIYIGGTPNLEFMTAGNYTRGFVGCIHSIEIQKSGVIHLRDSAVSAANAGPCSNRDSDSDNELYSRSYK